MKPLKPEKSIRLFLVAYIRRVCSVSSMHGAYYLYKPGLLFLERFLWLLTLLLCGNMIFYWTSFLITRHLESPLFLCIERDHVHWETFFPVLTICAHDKINESALQEFIRERNEDNSTELSLFLRSLINLSLDNLSHLLPSSNIDPKDYLTLIHRLSNVPNNYITIEGRSKLTFPFVPVLTEYGFCSTFNSLVLNAISWKYIRTGEKDPDQPVFKTFYAQGESVGTMLTLNETSSVDIYYYSPLGIPNSLQRVTVSDKSPLLTTLRFSSNDIVAHVKVKKLYQMQRRCLFFYESQLGHSPHVYSKELCLRECRIERMKGICGCLPPFYRLEGSWERYCGPGEEMDCIAKNLVEISNPRDCHCFASCDDTQFQLKGIQRVHWPRERHGLRIEAVPAKMRLRRNLQFSMVDLLVSFGGCTCLFMGVTALSLAEFSFFYAMHIWRAYRMYKGSGQ